VTSEIVPDKGSHDWDAPTTFNHLEATPQGATFTEELHNNGYFPDSEPEFVSVNPYVNDLYRFLRTCRNNLYSSQLLARECYSSSEGSPGNDLSSSGSFIQTNLIDLYGTESESWFSETSSIVDSEDEDPTFCVEEESDFSDSSCYSFENEDGPLEWQLRFRRRPRD
jgi:hypothetical protein